MRNDPAQEKIMNDVKYNIAKNIADLRQARKMTQLDLAEYLNYSDKTVSKWERADSMPDIAVLVEIADLFGVSLDELVKGSPSKTSQEKKERPNPIHRHFVITMLSVLLAWFIALTTFVMITIFMGGKVYAQWVAFVYALPVSFIIWLVFNSIWFNPRRNYLIISLLMWSLLASLHITLLLFRIDIVMIYLLGLLGQIIIAVWSLIGKKESRSSVPVTEESLRIS